MRDNNAGKTTADGGVGAQIKWVRCYVWQIKTAQCVDGVFDVFDVGKCDRRAVLRQSLYAGAPDAPPCPLSQEQYGRLNRKVSPILRVAFEFSFLFFGS